MAQSYTQSVAAAPAMRTTPDVHYDVDTTAYVEPKDRVRWASVLAGLVTVMATLIVFTVLGIAIGLSAFDPGSPNNYSLGAGAGIYGLIAGLIAFFFGGFVAARTAAVTGRDNGLLQGAIVWMITLVVVVNMLGAGIGTLLGITTDAATAALSAAGNVAGNAIDASGGADNAVADAANTTNLDEQAQAAASQAQQQIENVTPQAIENVADGASRAAWMTLLGLGLTAAAAIIGGRAGARSRREAAA